MREVTVRSGHPADAAELVPLFGELAHPASANQLHARLVRLTPDEAYASWVAVYSDRSPR